MEFLNEKVCVTCVCLCIISNSINSIDHFCISMETLSLESVCLCGHNYTVSLEVQTKFSGRYNECKSHLLNKRISFFYII